MSTTAPKVSQSQIAFFGYLFGNQEGYLYLATLNPDVPKNDAKAFKQHFFNWPEDKQDVSDFLEKTVRRNVYFCVSLLSQPKGDKQYCLENRLVHSDLDHCDPDEVTPKPSLILQTSEDRYQAIWRVEEVLPNYEREEYSKRIAYLYKDKGADTGCWNVNRLLRVPFTHNFKYENPFEVTLLQAVDTLVPLELLHKIKTPQVETGYEPSPIIKASESVPPIDQLPDLQTITYKYMVNIEGTGWRSIFGTEPGADEDWSAILWKFLNICFEAGMDKYEVFACAREAACNKYNRDSRPDAHLWADVLRAEEAQKRASLAFGYKEVLTMPDIVNGEKPQLRTFIDDYYDWATEATDAVPSFHELSGFILLSCIMSGGVQLKTQYGTVHPNLWGLVLGDSTLTRKTTAMSMAMNMLIEVDNNIILASDGTMEGMLTGLSERPNKTSVFYRDEITGFFDSVHRKDYLAGITETFTQLYDVPKLYTRRLKKDTYTVVSPVFIFFGGGIRDKVHSMLTEEYVLSGFLPRFLVVSGESDLSRIRRTGPPVGTISNKRDALQLRITDMYERFNRTSVVKLGSVETTIPAYTFAELTPEAWERYGEIEDLMTHTAHASSISSLALPTFERLTDSLLKMAILLAGSHSDSKLQTNEPLIITDVHISRAAEYIYRWGNYTIDLMVATGKSVNERVLDKVLSTIQRHPNVLRGQVMRVHALSSREATEILTTLEDRGYIITEKVGKGYRLRAV